MCLSKCEVNCSTDEWIETRLLQLLRIRRKPELPALFVGKWQVVSFGSRLLSMAPGLPGASHFRCLHCGSIGRGICPVTYTREFPYRFIAF